MTTKTDKVRFARLTTEEDLGGLVLRIRELKDRRKSATYYRLERNPNAAKAWRLHKLTHLDEEPVLYDVCLSGFGSCDCMGELSLRERGAETAEGPVRCKHIAAMQALCATGKLQ